MKPTQEEDTIMAMSQTDELLAFLDQSASSLDLGDSMATLVVSNVTIEVADGFLFDYSSSTLPISNVSFVSTPIGGSASSHLEYTKTKNRFSRWESQSSSSATKALPVRPRRSTSASSTEGALGKEDTNGVARTATSTKKSQDRPESSRTAAAPLRPKSPLHLQPETASKLQDPPSLLRFGSPAGVTPLTPPRRVYSLTA